MVRRSGPAGRPLRVGVCGNGQWAKTVHLPGLAAMPEVELVGVWGRSLERSEALASPFAIPAFADFDAMLDEVDAVSFAVAPQVQAGLALRAGDAGKHLLLEKPAATTLADANRLVEIVERRRLSAVTYLQRLFVEGSIDLIARAQAGRHTRCQVNWGSRALLPGSTVNNSVWRHGEYGTLWDLGPHVLSILIPVLGPVIRIEANRVRKAKFAFRTLHPGGAEATVALDQMDETVSQVRVERYVFSGGEGVTEGGPFKIDPVQSYIAAVRLMVDGVGTASEPAGPNIRHSRDIVAVLEAACASIEAGGTAVEIPQ